MADFDPFSLNQDQKDTDMPVFGSFDTTQTSKNDQKGSSNKDQENKDQENKDQDSPFAAFAPFDSGPSNTADDDQGFPTFESFDSGPKRSKEDDSMPTFESFATPSIDSKSNSTSQSKPPTFDSDSDDNNNNNDFILNNNKDKEPLYASFGESIHSISNAPQEEENVLQEEENQGDENSSLNFPSFGSFPAFESNKEKDENTDSKKTIDSFKSSTEKKNTSAIPEKKPKVQQESKLAAIQTLPSVKSLLKPIPGSQPTLDFYPDQAKISIQPPKPFKETALAKELSEYCMKVFNHQYVFTD